MELIQTMLKQDKTYMIAWLPVDKRVKPGSIVSLEKVEGKWKVVSQHSRIQAHEINRKWSNNI